MLVFLDSFQHYGPIGTLPERIAAEALIPRKWTNGNGTLSTSGPNGNWSCSQFSLRRTLPAGSGSYAASWKLKLDPGGSDYGRGDLCIWGAVSTQYQLRAISTLELLPDGRLAVIAGSSSIGTTPAPLPTGVWNTIEMNVQTGFDSISHQITVNTYVRINGITVLGTGFAPTGIFTTFQISGDAALTSCQFGGATVGTSAIAVPVIYDSLTDPFIGGEAPYNITSAQGVGGPMMWLGDVKIGVVYPNADVLTDWTSTGASSWDQINSVPPDPAKFISSSVPDQKDAFNWQDVANFPILTLQYSTYMNKNDAGSRVVGLRSGAGSTEVLLVGTSLSGSPYWTSQGRDNDPATGFKWTPAVFNAKQFGVNLDE